jgi:hypothetical protein
MAGKWRGAVVEAEERLLYGGRGDSAMEDGAEEEDRLGGTGLGVNFFPD